MPAYHGTIASSISSAKVKIVSVLPKKLSDFKREPTPQFTP